MWYAGLRMFEMLVIFWSHPSSRNPVPISYFPDGESEATQVIYKTKVTYLLVEPEPGPFPGSQGAEVRPISQRLAHASEYPSRLVESRSWAPS